MKEKILSFTTRRFPLIVWLSTFVFILPCSVISYFGPSPKSLLRSQGILSTSAYILCWAVISGPFLWAILRKHPPNKFFFIIGYPLMAIALIANNYCNYGYEPLGQDGSLNIKFIHDFRSQSDRSFMQFYNASSRPLQAIGHPRLTELAERCNQSSWITRHWTEDVPSNIRAALTPPLYFALISSAHFLSGWMPGWHIVFTLTFASASVVLMWYLFARYLDTNSTALLLFSFIQFGTYSFYMGGFLNDSPALFFFFLGFLLLETAGDKNNRWFALLSGISFAGAIFTRLTFLVIVPVMVSSYFLVRTQRRSGIILSVLSGIFAIFVVLLLTGYNPIVQFFVNIPLVGEYYSQWIITQLPMSLTTVYLLRIIKFFTAMGFGWLAYGIHACFRCDNEGLTPFWRNKQFLLTIPVLFIVFWFRDPQRNLTAIYPFLIGFALHNNPTLDIATKKAIIGSGAMVVLSFIVF